LLGQFLAAAILIYVGVRVQLPLPEWLNIALSVIWIVGITNAMNFMDNMDGLSAGVSGVAAAFILLLASTGNQYLVAALAAGTLGACLGFLRYNFRPARIFMGDAGSNFLGFLLAVLALDLRFRDNVNFVTWMVPVFILGLPILDTALVIVSRTRRRVNPLTTAGKDHLSHRLVAMGFSQMEAVLSLYLIAGAFGMTALFITNADVLEGYAIALAAVILGLVAIWRLETRWPVKLVGDGEKEGVENQPT
jgi:UDP-GlcNAc:undecaprenyl-phosphate GlcNAc-1-phosphate transferase